MALNKHQFFSDIFSGLVFILHIVAYKHNYISLVFVTSAAVHVLARRDNSMKALQEDPGWGVPALI